MDGFLRLAPKVELHAHLNGSLSTGGIQELGKLLYGENTPEFLDLSRKFIDFNGLDLNACFQKFRFMHELTATKTGLEQATLLIIRDLARDNVIYVELRSTPKSNEHMSKRAYLECVLGAIAKARVLYPDVYVQLLPSIDRSQSVSAAEETLDIVLQMCEERPGILPGIDLSGNPHCGEFRDFVPVLTRARQSGLKLTLHCAEIENPGEIAEMVKFGMDRCGHGTFLNEEQLKLLNQSNVAIECCLSSNVKCGTVPTYDDHHFKRIFAAGNAVVLCTDDSGVFDTTLTQEFQLAANSFALTELDYRVLSMHAVQHSFTDEARKKHMREHIEKYFKTPAKT